MEKISKAELLRRHKLRYFRHYFGTAKKPVVLKHPQQQSATFAELSPNYDYQIKRDQ